MRAALLVVLALPAGAQTPGERRPEPPSAVEPPADPLGRDTPRGTMAGFNEAVHREDFVAAARFLQLDPERRSNAERLSRDLTNLIDRYYIEPIAALSDEPEGRTDDGLPPDRERVALSIAGEPDGVELVRVKDPQSGGLVWVVSSRTLAQVPALRRSAGGTWLERVLPRALVEWTVFDLSVARLVAWVATLVIPLAALWLLSTVFMAAARVGIASAMRRRRLESWYAALRWPVILVLALGIHLALVPLLGFSLRFRMVHSRIMLAAAVVAAAWLLWRFMALSFTHARIMAQRSGEAGIRSLLLLAERVFRAIVVLVAVFALLTIAGVDTTAALAGVGIGGVAVALGAQKSVENLLGGVFLLTDRVLAVGDTCSISNRLGVVEDITMRSVRLRTLEQTLLSVPAGVLSQSSVENFATRNKILAQSTLRLQYGTTADQLKRVLNGVRALLGGHPEIEAETARIRLVDFGERAIEIELFAYVLTPDQLKFLAVREDLLLQIAAIVESAGTSFAQPTIVHEKPGTEADVEVRASHPRRAMSDEVSGLSRTQAGRT